MLLYGSLCTLQTFTNRTCQSSDQYLQKNVIHAPQIKMEFENKNIELKELSIIENFDKITLLVCTQNGLTDLLKILNFHEENGNFFSLDYSNSKVNQKLLSICKKYEGQLENDTIDLKQKEIENTEQETVQLTPNYTLETLIEIENLGIRGYNACKYFSLLTLKDLIEFYSENGTFLKVRNCGRKSNEELIAICEKYKSYQFAESKELTYKENETIVDILNQSLYQLVTEEELSVRVQNVCESNRLNNLNLILEYYNKHGDFKKLRNCGSNSNSELIELCKKYVEFSFQSNFSDIEESEFKNPLCIQIEELTIKHKAVLNNIIFSKYNQLSVRSKNALSNLLQNSITVGAIKEEFFVYENYDIKKIKNVGESSEKEIAQFINEIKDLIELVTIFEDKEILKEYYNSYLIKNYQVSYETINKIGNNYDFSLGYPIFKTIYHLIKGGYLFDKNQENVFFGLFNIFHNTTVPLIKDFKSNLKLTNERYRQIRNKTLKKFPNTIYCLFNIEFSFENLNTYQISLKDECITLSDEDVLKINRNEEVSFNSHFIIYIFSILFKDTHSLIGDSENVFFNKSSNNRHDWNNFYLITNDLTWIFDFEKFIIDIYNRLSSRIEEDYQFHFQAYLLNFQNENCISKIDTITTICESILFSEFEMILDTEENIIFRKNTKKQVIEYVYEILEEKNEPLNVYELFDFIEIKYPNVSKNAEALRGSCQGDTNLIFFGRSSTYGLKKWEDELNIRGGTIRDIAEEFLFEQTEPKHIDEITDFVNKYRDTNAKNIYANLKMEKNNRFVFYTGLMIGLKSKKYEEANLVKTKNVQIEQKTWDVSFNQLKLFAQNNNRLPYSAGSESEQRIYISFYECSIK